MQPMTTPARAQLLVTMLLLMWMCANLPLCPSGVSAALMLLAHRSATGRSCLVSTQPGAALDHSIHCAARAAATCGLAVLGLGACVVLLCMPASRPCFKQQLPSCTMRRCSQQPSSLAAMLCSCHCNIMVLHRQLDGLRCCCCICVCACSPEQGSQHNSSAVG
jgi:hypothetical protein